METHFDQVRTAYERGAQEYAERWAEPHAFMQEERAAVLKRVQKGMGLLDVGCGPGNDTAYWAGNGLEPIGIDLSPEMVKLARQRFPHLRFIEMNILDAPTLNIQFDVIWMAYVLLHIPVEDVDTVIDILHRILRPQGFLFVSTSLSLSTESIYQPVLGLTKDGEGIPVPQVRWSLEDLRRNLLRHFAEDWVNIVRPLPNVPGREIYNAILVPKHE